MFEFFRSHKRVLQFILVVLIFPSFVFFGVQGYSRFTDESFAPVAEVDGAKISRVEWDQAHQRSVENLRRQVPGLDVKLLDTPEAKRRTLDELVRERVLLAAAAKDQLLPTDERLARLFRSDAQFAAFRNPDGSVNRDILSAQGLTSEGFAQRLRTDLGLRQVLGGVEGTAFVPKATVTQALDALLQQREVQWQLFDAPSQAAKVQVADADLEAYFKANEAEFKLPEQARIDYVVLDLETVKKTLSTSEEDLRKYYTENESRYTRAEERRASHILINAPKDAPAADRKKAREQAEALLTEVRRAPTQFAELAKKNSQDPGSAPRGGDLDFFGRGAMVKPFEDAVFAMKAGEIGNIVETDFGYHIIQLTGVRGGEKQAFESVRAEVEAEVRKQLAQRKYAELAEQFTNTVYEQADSLQPAVDKFKLEKRSATVMRTAPPGATGPLASPKLLGAVFAEDAVRNKRNTDAVDLGNSTLVSARVVEHMPSRTPPLADVKDRVRLAVIAQKAAELARKDGQARLEAVKADPGAALPQKGVVSRGQAQGLPRSVVDAVLAASADKLPAALGVDLGRQGFVVVRVLKVLPREGAEAVDALIAPQLAQAWGAAESQAYYEALKRRFKVEIRVPDAAKAEKSADAASR
jgi:peptidyl-prolyl cis-trans isomerase D